MFSVFFYLVISGALLGVAKSGFECFGNKMKNFEDDLMRSFTGGSEEMGCGDSQKALIDLVQQAIDQCSVNVSTDSLKSLYEEFCDPESELYEALEQSEMCLMSLDLNMHSNYRCINSMDLNLPALEACVKFKRNFFTCSARAEGSSCGEKAVKALLRIYQTADALTDGVCEEFLSTSSSLTTRATEWQTVERAITDWPTMDWPTTSLSTIFVHVVKQRKTSFLERYRYLLWIGIAVAVLTVFAVIMMIVKKKNAQNRSSWESVKAKVFV